MRGTVIDQTQTGSAQYVVEQLIGCAQLAFIRNSIRPDA